jgi:outer membrane protein assembly factor BamB
MRNALLAGVLALAWSAAGCGGSSGSRTPPPLGQDYAGNFTGVWNVAGTVAMGSSTQSVSGLQEVTSSERNVLSFTGACNGTALRAVVTSASSFEFDRLVCSQAEPCGTVTVSFDTGRGEVTQGTMSVVLQGTASGCGQTMSYTFSFSGTREVVSPVPTVLSLDPSVAASGGPSFTLTVIGSGFVSGSTVAWNGNPRPTTFVSATELHAAVTASDIASAGQAVVTVQSPAPGGGTSNTSSFTVATPVPAMNPAPTVLSLDPSVTAPGGPSFTLIVAGSGFVSGSTVAWNGDPRPTTFVSATELHAAIAAADIASAGQTAVTVQSPAPGGGTSNASTFTIANPVPAISALYPASAVPGSPRFTLTVIGTDFAPESSVLWNGSARTTTFISATELHATVEAADVASAGPAMVSVSSPPPGGGVSASLPFTIATTNVSLSPAIAYQIDPAHSGRAVFGSTLGFPPSPTWKVNLGSAISYPLVVAGKVIVLTAGSGTGGYGTQLYALEQGTGAVSWGPIAISGTYFWAGHAYDGGKVFVVNYDGLLRSFDVATGTAGWSVKLPGQYSFSAPPTAANGIVYVGGAGSGGTVYAVDEANGNVLWTQQVMNGDQSSPAVSPDGVFVSYPCQIYKFDLVTGSPLWHVSGGCEGGGGKTAAYANGSLYVRDPYETTPVGTIFDGVSGAKTGAFGAGSGWMPIPAFGASAGFFSSGGTLRAEDFAAQNVAWSFAGDGQLSSAPIVIDGVVIVGSASGNVYALDAATGSQAWVSNAGAAIPAPDEQNVSQPLTGLGAGEGYLVVPAGNTLSAWHIAGP